MKVHILFVLLFIFLFKWSITVYQNMFSFINRKKLFLLTHRRMDPAHRGRASRVPHRARLPIRTRRRW